MADLLTDYANVQGEKLAVVDDRPDGTIIKWSYAELEANANRLGRVLIDHGVAPRTKIMWCGQNSPWIVACMQASRKIGAIAVPLNYRLTPDEASYVVDNSDSQVIFTDAEFAPLFAEIRDQIPQVREILVFDGNPGPDMKDALPLIDKADSSEIDLGIEPGEAGTMIYTSGTTGKPKGAVRGNVGDPEQVAKMLAFMGAHPDDIYLTTGPLYHSGPGGFLGMSYALGNTAVLQRKFDAEDWLRIVDKYKVSSTFSAPTTIRRVCQLSDDLFKKYSVASMRLMVANAAPWSFALKKLYLSKFPTHSLFEVYGSTELGVNTILGPDHQLTKPGSCGQPAPGVEIKLYDENGKEVTVPRQEGELYVKSPSVFTTYHKAQEKYEADRRGDMQTVGDIAYFDEEGFYYICDRKKDMIISGGVNIYPAEIEDVLEHHDDIMDVAVFGVPNEEWGEAVHAVVVIRPGSGLTDADIIAYGREHLANYKVPRSISFMDEIPRTGSGKTLKRTLREPFWQDYNSQVG